MIGVNVPENFRQIVRGDQHLIADGENTDVRKLQRGVPRKLQTLRADRQLAGQRQPFSRCAPAQSAFRERAQTVRRRLDRGDQRGCIEHLASVCAPDTLLPSSRYSGTLAGRTP